MIFAPDGEQAWQQLDSDDPPAIALLDWEMPGLQGPEVVQRIRSKHAPDADLRHPADLARLIRRHRAAACAPAPTIT